MCRCGETNFRLNSRINHLQQHSHHCYSIQPWLASRSPVTSTPADRQKYVIAQKSHTTVRPCFISHFHLSTTWYLTGSMIWRKWMNIYVHCIILSRDKDLVGRHTNFVGPNFQYIYIYSRAVLFVCMIKSRLSFLNWGVSRVGVCLGANPKMFTSIESSFGVHLYYRLF